MKLTGSEKAPWLFLALFALLISSAITLRATKSGDSRKPQFEILRPRSLWPAAQGSIRSARSLRYVQDPHTA